MQSFHNKARRHALCSSQPTNHADAALFHHAGAQTFAQTESCKSRVADSGHEGLECRVQVETGDPICWLSSANLMEVAPTFHIARFLPSIKDSKAPFTFALQACPLLSHLPFSPDHVCPCFLLAPFVVDLYTIALRALGLACWLEYTS